MRAAKASQSERAPFGILRFLAAAREVRVQGQHAVVHVARDQPRLLQKRQGGAHQALIPARSPGQGVEGDRAHPPPQGRLMPAYTART